MGLNAGDLKLLVDEVFEVDSFKSKMGDDKDIVTLSFSVHEREAAKDLMNFCEKGYPFVLDADVSTGEQSDGTYKVFVEIERSRDIPEQLEEMIYGIAKLAEIEKPRFRYYKGFESVEATTENLASRIPLEDSDYETKIHESRLNNFENFFAKTHKSDIIINERNEITIFKPFATPMTLQVIAFGDTNTTIENISETINLNDMGEVLFLTKYLGDYNITKFGDKVSLTNDDKTLIVKRK
jgi:hypothetical protein